MNPKNGRENKVFDNILQCIGNTPIVKLNRIPKTYGLECQMYAKCEFMNPGGSIKDRICHAMVQKGETSGDVNEGTTLIEPTSGNTGIGMALTAAICGYKFIVVTPDKNSDEKMSTMRILGSDVIQTRASASYGDPEHFQSVAKRLLKEIPNSVCLNQYSNNANPVTHYEHTAEEILDALGTVDMFVAGSGTGGTVSGIARKLKEKCPNCIVVAVDPQGSTMFEESNPGPYFVEGIGGDYVPDVLDKSIIDKVIHANDYQAFNMSREVIEKEGLLCGGSSGSITYAAVQAAKEFKLGPDKKVVVILPDGIRNYMTKFVSDQWMEAHLFKEPPKRDFLWWNKRITDLKINRSVPSIKENNSCLDALAAMGSENTVAFIVNDYRYLKDIVCKDNLTSEATKADFHFNDPVKKHVMKKYCKIDENKESATVGLAARILDITPFVVVVEEKANDNINNPDFIPRGIITPEMILDFIIKHQNNN